MRRRLSVRGGMAAALALLFIPTIAGAALGAGKSDIPAGRAATEKYKDIDAAFGDGYAFFYTCTEQPGVGTMGQHLLNTELLGNDAIDPLRPEVLVYAPQRSGELRLVGVEYVTFDTSGQPSVLGQPMLFRAAGNRYGLPDFYERHAWIWQGNPLGTFNDWNPDITCLGNGDNGG